MMLLDTRLARRGLGTLGALCLLGMIVVPSASSAQGCGPTRLKVNVSTVVDMPPAKLWGLVGNFQDMRWNRAVAALAGTGGNDAAHAVRTVTLKGGTLSSESLYKYDAQAMSYSYHVDRTDTDLLPVQNASATLEVVAAPGGRSRLIWRAAFYRLIKPEEPAPDVADAKAAAAVDSYLRNGLEGLTAKLGSKS